MSEPFHIVPLEEYPKYIEFQNTLELTDYCLQQKKEDKTRGVAQKHNHDSLCYKYTCDQFNEMVRILDEYIATLHPCPEIAALLKNIHAIAVTKEQKEQNSTKHVNPNYLARPVDYASLRVADLKTLMQMRGLSMFGCLENTDIIERLLQYDKEKWDVKKRDAEKNGDIGSVPNETVTSAKVKGDTEVADINNVPKDPVASFEVKEDTNAAGTDNVLIDPVSSSKVKDDIKVAAKEGIKKEASEEEKPKEADEGLVDEESNVWGEASWSSEDEDEDSGGASLVGPWD